MPDKVAGIRRREVHNKSRHGCITCKGRRVKCDEQGYPDGPCAACVIRNIECTYKVNPQIPRPSTSFSSTRVEPSVKRQQERTPVPRGEFASDTTDTEALTTVDRLNSVLTMSTASTPTNLLNQLPENSIQQLRLMQVWCTKTCCTFAGRKHRDIEMWRGVLTDLAFKHKFLLDIILATTSFQIATEEAEPSSKAMHTTNALEYQVRALGLYREELQKLSAENCTAIFACALLNMVCSHTANQLLTASQELMQTPLQSFLALYESVYALVDTLRRAGTWLVGGPLDEAYGAAHGRGTETDKLLHEWSRSNIGSITTAMSRLRMLTRRVPMEKHPMYFNTIVKLEDHFLRATEHILRWLAFCSPAFMQHVREKEPVALMILTHWGILIKLVDESWWLLSSGARLVEQLIPMLQACDDSEEWNDAIEWCRQRMGRANPG